jgi:hypothetical protein
MSIGFCRRFVEGDKRNAGFDLTDLGPMGDHYGWVGIVNHIGQKVRRVCKLENKESPTSTEGGEAGNHVVSTSRQKHANKTVSTDSVATKATGKGIDLDI